MSFTANYPGNCACCNWRFEKGEEVAYTFDGLIIASHAKKDPYEEKLGEVCSKCFSVKALNGTCLCEE